MSKPLMSRTLNLVEQLTARGRKLQELGFKQEAAQCWTRLTGLGGLPTALAREAQTCLAEFHLDRGKHARARRLLSAALTRQPGNAHFHYLMGTAIDNDDKGDRRRALYHYRQAAELQPEEPRYLCAFGLTALEVGDDDEEGITALRGALELAPNDPEVLGDVLSGIEARDREEASRLLRLAMFRNQRDLRFRKLWNDFHFRCLHADQTRRYQPNLGSEAPVLLPFLRPELEGRQIRRDAPARPAKPHFHMPSHGKKHA